MWYALGIVYDLKKSKELVYIITLYTTLLASIQQIQVKYILEI